MGRFDIRTRTGLISTIIQGQSLFDSDAQAFIDRVTAAGGTLSLTEREAVNNLTLSLKSSGVWTNIKAIYPMIGASAAACAQNLKSSSFTGAFSGSWTFANTGATPNGTNAYMTTGFNSSIHASANSGCFGYYSRTNNGSKNMAELGALSTNYFFMHACLSNTTYFMPNTVAAAGYIQFANTNSSGFFQAFRTGATTIGGRWNTNTYSGTINYASVNLECWVGARNPGSNPPADAYYSNRQCALAYFGDSINDTQAGSFYTAVQTFQTSLSRQV